MLGTNESVESFVREFIAKRKATDYLRVGAENLYRFKPSEITDYKNLFKQVPLDGDRVPVEYRKDFSEILLGHRLNARGSSTR